MKREELKIRPCASLCAFKLAEHLEFPIYPATKYFVLEKEIEWLSNDCEGNALTMSNIEGTKIVLHNPFHSDGKSKAI